MYNIGIEMDITIVIAGLLFAMFYTVSKNLKGDNTDGTYMPENWPQMPLPEEIADESGETAELSAPVQTETRQSAGREHPLTAQVATNPARTAPDSHHADTGHTGHPNPIGHELRSPQGARRAFIFSEIFKNKYI